MKTLTILGGGSWGTALAIVLAPGFSQVRLWIFEPELAALLQNTRENPWYLPGFRVPANVRVEPDLAQALAGSDCVLGVVPTQHARSVWRQAAQSLPHGAIVVSAAKGLETDSLARPSEVIAQELGDVPLAVLSGPTFAREVAAGHPTALVVASRQEHVANRIQAAFSGPKFRAYTNDDVAGVELAAALKNVIAIGAGICEGLGLGSNSTAALITRGLAEMTRLAVRLGGKRDTLFGLAGLGDLVLTCTGELSRNRQCGIALGSGRSLEDFAGSTRMIAEGVKTTAAAHLLARQAEVEMPITSQMYAVLYEKRSPHDAIDRLMSRELKPESR